MQPRPPAIFSCTELSNGQLGYHMHEILTQVGQSPEIVSEPMEVSLTIDSLKYLCSNTTNLEIE